MSNDLKTRIERLEFVLLSLIEEIDKGSIDLQYDMDKIKKLLTQDTEGKET